MASAAVAHQESAQNAVPTSAAAPASQPRADAAPVRIDAVVTDTRGRPVSGLRASDFELIENGTAQTLTDVEFRTVPAAAEAVPPIVTDADEVQATSNTCLYWLSIARGSNLVRIGHDRRYNLCRGRGPFGTRRPSVSARSRSQSARSRRHAALTLDIRGCR